MRTLDDGHGIAYAHDALQLDPRRSERSPREKDTSLLGDLLRAKRNRLVRLLRFGRHLARSPQVLADSGTGWLPPSETVSCQLRAVDSRLRQHRVTSGQSV